MSDHISFFKTDLNLGKYIFQLEDSDVEMCDEIYEVYTDLLQQSEEEDDALCYKTYYLVSSAGQVY